MKREETGWFSALSLSLLLALFLAAAVSPAPARAADPVALVYNGPLSADDCAEAVTAVAREAGLAVRFYSSPRELPGLLPGAALLILGGTTDELAPLMRDFTPEVREAVKSYLRQGGRYLGICGGGFVASTGWDEDLGRVEGLGLVAASTTTHDQDFGPRILPITWQGRAWPMYVRAGPAFHPQTATRSDQGTVRAVATYANGELAALLAGYGKGRLFLVGPHPEARESWPEEATNGKTWVSTTHLLRDMIRALVSGDPLAQ